MLKSKSKKLTKKKNGKRIKYILKYNQKLRNMVESPNPYSSIRFNPFTAMTEIKNMNFLFYSCNIGN